MIVKTFYKKRVLLFDNISCVDCDTIFINEGDAEEKLYGEGGENLKFYDHVHKEYKEWYDGEKKLPFNCHQLYMTKKVLGKEEAIIVRTKSIIYIMNDQGKTIETFI